MPSVMPTITGQTIQIGRSFLIWMVDQTTERAMDSSRPLVVEFFDQYERSRNTFDLGVIFTVS
jgi:hypothetical protein